MCIPRRSDSWHTAISLSTVVHLIVGIVKENYGFPKMCLKKPYTKTVHKCNLTKAKNHKKPQDTSGVELSDFENF